ncbi:hypothetical protein B0H13DRAFT_1910129 [Mycena leptocephala]|nr:hypothetical protein B0H13DRAFT_1910129 [Mycena leptocephala]
MDRGLDAAPRLGTGDMVSRRVGVEADHYTEQEGVQCWRKATASVPRQHESDILLVTVVSLRLHYPSLQNLTDASSVSQPRRRHPERHLRPTSSWNPASATWWQQLLCLVIWPPGRPLSFQISPSTAIWILSRVPSPHAHDHAVASLESLNHGSRSGERTAETPVQCSLLPAPSNTKARSSPGYCLQLQMYYRPQAATKMIPRSARPSAIWLWFSSEKYTRKRQGNICAVVEEECSSVIVILTGSRENRWTYTRVAGE